MLIHNALTRRKRCDVLRWSFYYQHKRCDETVETQNLGENQNKDHSCNKQDTRYES